MYDRSSVLLGDSRESTPEDVLVCSFLAPFFRWSGNRGGGGGAGNEAYPGATINK